MILTSTVQRLPKAGEACLNIQTLAKEDMEMKFVITRDLAVKVNWILDNLMPPVLRDSRLFMKAVEFLIYGKKGTVFLDFKEKGSYLKLSPAELKALYQEVANASTAMTRPTDLNHVMEETILSFFRSKAGQSINILDIACGRGYLAKKLAELSAGFDVYGVDIIIPDSLQCLENLHFLEGEIEHIPFPDHFFDVVVCAYTLEHVLNLDTALAELRRVCKGTLIAVVPCEREYQYTTNLHTYWFPYPHTIQRLFHNPDGTVVKRGGDFAYFENCRNCRKTKEDGLASGQAPG